MLDDCGFDSLTRDEAWMREALREAHRCLRTDPSAASATAPTPQSPPATANPQSTSRKPQADDVPVGAICVRDGIIVGRGHNRREADGDPTAHAEVLALRAAAEHLGRWRLNDVTLYVTLEPCVMCAGAIWLARVERVVFGAWDARTGACGSLYDITRDPRLNHRPQVRGGVLAEPCAAILEEFLAGQRRGGKPR